MIKKMAIGSWMFVIPIFGTLFLKVCKFWMPTFQILVKSAFDPGVE